MLPPLGALSGTTSWIICLNSPRLNRALARVAVLTPRSFSIVLISRSPVP